MTALRDELVESTPQTRTKGDVPRFVSDHPVAELSQPITDAAPGRTDRDLITLFNSVCFAVADFVALPHVRDLLPEIGHFVHLDLLADGSDLRSLCGMPARARLAG